jgi:CRISPR-associated protein (TIGR03986 family)
MFRNLIEIITFSRVSAVTPSQLIYRSVGGSTNHDINYRKQMMKQDHEREASSSGNTKYYIPRIRGGYMVGRGNDWAIHPAKEFDGTTYAHIGINEERFRSFKSVRNCKNAYKVFIKSGPYEFQKIRGGFLRIKFAKVVDSNASPQTGLRSATLARSGRMFSKKSEAVVYEADPNAELLPLTDEQVDAYRVQISKEQIKLLGKNGALNDGQPIFYLEKDGKVIFFGHARMFRIPYTFSPLEYVPKELRATDEPENPNEVDYTEAIFGYTRKTGKGRERSYAGRVSFSDAKIIPKQNNIWLDNEPVTPKILASPKPTTFQHYLVQPEPDLYPAGRTRDGRTKYETRLDDYESSPEDDTVIRGHKFYWHKGAVGLDDIREKKALKSNDTQHTKIKPLRKEVKFKFRLRFDNLASEELGSLMWIFNTASSPNIRLKIGMGKPLGMGAIQLNAKLYLAESKNRYQSLFNKNEWESGVQEANTLAISFQDKFVTTISNKLGLHFKKSLQRKALLVMHQWPGIEKDWSRYMEIQKKEYRGRPVLPSPFGVWSKHKK